MSASHLCTNNRERILKKAKVFGLVGLGDRAIMKRMSLLNILVMWGEAPVVFSVCKCTDHLVDRKQRMLNIS